MGQQRAVYQWTATLTAQLSCLSKPQAKVVAAFSWGGAVARRCTLRIVAEALPWFGKPDKEEETTTSS